LETTIGPEVPSLKKVALELWNKIQGIICKHCNMRKQARVLQNLAQQFRHLFSIFRRIEKQKLDQSSSLWAKMWSRYFGVSEVEFVDSQEMNRDSKRIYRRLGPMSRGKPLVEKDLRMVQNMCACVPALI
jgi:hypothetical protein